MAGRLTQTLIRLTAAAALILSACAQSAAQPAVEAPPAPRAGVLQAPPADPAQCARRGGQVQTVCRSRSQMCVVPYPDGGKTCSGRKDCQGRCLYKGDLPAGSPATGTCQKDNAPCGCFTMVEDGKVSGGLCVD